LEKAASYYFAAQQRRFRSESSQFAADNRIDSRELTKGQGFENILHNVAKSIEPEGSKQVDSDGNELF